jgi:hypothetical protein
MRRRLLIASRINLDLIAFGDLPEQSLGAGVLLLKRNPAGYLLAAPVVTFLATMGLGLVGMVIAMAAMGTRVGLPDFIPAVLTATLGLSLAVHFAANIRGRAGAVIGEPESRLSAPNVAA